MDPRLLLARRGLAAKAVAALTAHALGDLPAEALGPTKTLLKRFLAAPTWGDDDAEALADAVGPGRGWWAERLDEDLTLEFGWSGTRFGLRVVADPGRPAPDAADATPFGLEASFAGPIVPEATPNPRTIAFRTGPLHDEDSRSYRSAAEAGDDRRVARLFDAFPELATVLVARDFVALTVRRADRWEQLLAPALHAVTEEFAGAGPATGPAAPGTGGPAAAAVAGDSPLTGSGTRGMARETRLDRAWHRLGQLRASDPRELERIVAAARGRDTAERQLAAGLLKDAPPEVAAATWSSLGTDPSRLVRRAAVDAMVDAGRAELRPLLERALGDGDAWVRWKALRGLVELGSEASRPSIEALAADPDFRVRLEAHGALRSRP